MMGQPRQTLRCSLAPKSASLQVESSGKVKIALWTCKSEQIVQQGIVVHSIGRQFCL